MNAFEIPFFKMLLEKGSLDPVHAAKVLDVPLEVLDQALENHEGLGYVKLHKNSRAFSPKYDFVLLTEKGREFFSKDIS